MEQDKQEETITAKRETIINLVWQRKHFVKGNTFNWQQILSDTHREYCPEYTEYDDEWDSHSITAPDRKKSFDECKNENDIIEFLLSFSP